MKNTGIIRRPDDLGRIIIPKEIRNTLHIKENDPLEIYTHENMVCFKKMSPFFNNQKIIDTAMKMAKREDLTIAIYDTDKQLTNDVFFPSTVSDSWRVTSLFNFHKNFVDSTGGYILFPVVANGELCGLVAVHKQDLFDDEFNYAEMIADYLSVTLEEN